MCEPVISCKNLTKEYKLSGKSKIALEDIDFNAYPGDRIGLVGLNGSGKSTLLKILSGQIKPTSGSIMMCDPAIQMSHFDSLLHPDLTGEENIKLHLSLLGLKSSDFQRIILDIREFSELNDFIYQPVKTYSSGMMLRLTFSLFKQFNPKILLLDEVLSAGDAAFQRKVDNMLKHFFNEVKVLVIATHNLSEIANYCNKCIILEKGKMVFMGSVNEALEKYYNIASSMKSNKQQRTDNIFIEGRFSENKETFFLSEKIIFSVKYKKVSAEKLDLVLYLRNNYQNVLSDCEIYREDFSVIPENPGIYEIKCEIPPFLLNVGNYHIDISFGNGTEEMELNVDALNFNVIPDEWEKSRLWNTNPVYPLRPHLKWTKVRLK